MRRRALRHGNAAAARDFPAYLGNYAGAVLAQGDCGSAQQISRASPSWPRFIGTSNGPYNSRALAIATTSGSMTACEKAVSDPSGTICSPASTIRTSSPAFSKIMTSHGQRLNFLGRSTRRQRSSPTCHLACAFFIRASPRERGSGCRPISVAARSSRQIGRSRPFTPSYCKP